MTNTALPTAWTRVEPPYVPPPPDTQEVAARDARRARLTAEFAKADQERARFNAFHRDRDRRPLRPLQDAWRAYLLHRAAPGKYPYTDAIREWRDDTLMDLAAKQLECQAVDPVAVGRPAVVRSMLERGLIGWMPAVTTRGGYLAASDFASLLDAVAAVLFIDAYHDTVRSFEAWTTAVTVVDFRSTIAAVVTFPELRTVPEHAEYQSGSPFGPAVPVRLTTFGRVIQFSRAAALRDDVPEFAQLQTALGVAAASVENDVVYDLLLSNPTMADGFPLFSTQHANQMPAKALDATSLAAACTTLATNSNHGRPAFLVVGTADGPTARNLVTIQTPPNATEASGVLQVIQDDRITGGFYVTCDPSERPTICTAHLAGIDGPELLVADGWDVDARLYKGRDEFGASVVSASAMVHTPAP